MAQTETKGTAIDSEIGLELKAKVAIVNSEGEILTLRRSPLEDTRQGEWDWPGGSFDEGETSILGVLGREVQLEELRGTQLHDVRPLHVRGKILDGGFKVSLLLAGRATFPPEGIVLGYEHDAFAWFSPEHYPGLDIPKKYRTAVALGAPVFEELVQLINADRIGASGVKPMVALAA